MKDSDYYVKMLRVFFKDNNIGEKTKQKLLDTNPFNEQFVRWENNYIKGNKAIAKLISRNQLIDKNTIANEKTELNEDTILQFLNYQKPVFYNKTDNIKNITIMRDLSVGNSTRLKDFLNKNNHFVVGLSTPNREEYIKKLELYRNLLKNHKTIKILEDTNNKDRLNTCIIYK